MLFLPGSPDSYALAAGVNCERVHSTVAIDQLSFQLPALFTLRHPFIFPYL